MGSINQKSILIIGGTGIIGEGIVKVLLKNGATVVVPSGLEKRLSILRQRTDNPENLYTPLVDIMTLAGAKELLSWINGELGEINAIIVCTNEWWQGVPLLNISLDTWHKLLEKRLTTQLILAKNFLPALFGRQGSSFIFVNRSAGLNPVCRAGPVAITTAGEIMLKNVLALENANTPVRINSLLVNIPVAEAEIRENSRVTTSDAGEYCLYLLSENAAHIKGQTIIFDDRSQLEQLNSLKKKSRP